MTFPLGPYHPALVEPLALRLALRGEQVTGVDIHTRYLHRGVEELAAQKDLEGMLDLVERTCGTCGAGYRLAACMALESAAGVTPPPLAQSLRTIFAELERALARLWLLQQVGRLGEFGALFTLAVEARELLFEAATQATGRRLFWSIAVPGGVRAVEDPHALAEVHDEIVARLNEIDEQLGPRGMAGRTLTRLAIIDENMATDTGLTGLVLRATGLDDDLRISAPYAAYAAVKEQLTWEPEGFSGDAASRLRLAAHDVRVSLAIIEALLTDLPDGQDHAPVPPTFAFSEATAAIEAARGRASVTLHLADGPRAKDPTAPGWLKQVALQTPGAANVGVVPIVLNRQRLSDIPLVLASLDLCIACTDR